MLVGGIYEILVKENDFAHNWGKIFFSLWWKMLLLTKHHKLTSYIFRHTKAQTHSKMLASQSCFLSINSVWRQTTTNRKVFFWSNDEFLQKSWCFSGVGFKNLYLLLGLLFLYYNSASDWKFGAEQFVRNLPDKVFVHCEYILSAISVVFQHLVSVCHVILPFNTYLFIFGSYCSKSKLFFCSCLLCWLTK